MQLVCLSCDPLYYMKYMKNYSFIWRSLNMEGSLWPSRIFGWHSVIACWLWKAQYAWSLRKSDVCFGLAQEVGCRRKWHCQKQMSTMHWLVLLRKNLIKNLFHLLGHSVIYLKLAFYFIFNWFVFTMVMFAIKVLQYKYSNVWVCLRHKWAVQHVMSPGLQLTRKQTAMVGIIQLIQSRVCIVQDILANHKN